MRKKILLIVPSLEIGGQERIAVNTAEGLKERYDVDIVIFQQRNVECYKTSCNIINLNIPTTQSRIGKVINQLKRSIKICSLRNREKYSCVMSFGNTANLSNAISGIFGKGKTICAIHGFAEVRKSIVLSIVIGLSDKVICIAKAMQAGLLKIYPRCKNSIVIENGYILKEDPGVGKGTTVQSTPIFVSMGRLEYVKGFDILIRAFEKVQRSVPEAELWIIGDGSQRKSLEEDCRLKRIDHAVKILGYQKNPHDILKNASVYVLPSRNEGLPNALIEALNARLPVISVDCESGPREILTGEYKKRVSFGIEYACNGILVENYTNEDARIERLSEAMISLVNSREKQEEYKSRAFQRSQDYSLLVYIDKLCALIEAL